jgi:predicted nucleotidyltransferase
MQGISEEEKKILISTIREQFPKVKILFFGSRYRGDHRQYSDLDLCIDNGSPVDLVKFSNLKEKLSQSDLLFSVDLVDWHRMSQKFQAVVLGESQVWN